MKKYISFFVLLAVALTSSATERSATKMRQAALKTLSGAKVKSVLSKPTLEVYSDGTRFSIVSRDDRFPEVLAYGFGDFDIEQAPDNVKWWFERIQRSMEVTAYDDVPRHANRSYIPIKPMVETKWGQDTPYNNYCPTIGKTNAPTGCIATAMAQIMNYHQYPASANFVGRYKVNNRPYTESVNSTYLYPYKIAYGYYIPENSSSVIRLQYTVSEGNSIAELMRDCGYAVEMMYESDGSGAYSYMAGCALVEKFGYPQESVKYLMRDYFTDDEWMDMLYKELSIGCPVLYGGSSEKSGGHAFVFHGMDAEGRACVNWGWQGQFDGYYSIDVLNPGGEDFSEDEDMIIGIRPEARPDDAMSCFIADIPYTFSYNNILKKLTLNFPNGIFNAGIRTFTGRWYLVVEDVNNPNNTTYIDIPNTGGFIEFLSGYTGSFSHDFIATSSYRIYVATKDTDEADWQKVRTIGGAFYYEMTVSDKGIVTIADSPTFVTSSADNTAVRDILYQPESTSSDVRYYDMQGRELSNPTKGFVIRRQGGETKKIFIK